MTAIVFAMGGLLGFVIGLIVDDAVLQNKKTYTEYKAGIDPNKLVAWIECQLENYEYVAPPTAGEIVRKIREMERSTTNDEE